MKEASLVRAPTTKAQASMLPNDAGLLHTLVAAVPARNTPANDNPAVHNLPPCLAVTDDEVTLLHRYLSREILDLFS